MPLEILPNLALADRNRGIGEDFGGKRDVANLRRIVRVAVDRPQLRIGNVRPGNQLFSEFCLGDLGAVVALQHLQHPLLLHRRASDPPLILGRIELPFRLEFRIAEELRGRGRKRRLSNLVHGYVDPPAIQLLPDQDVCHQLIECRLLHAPLIVQSKCAALLLRATHVLVDCGLVFRHRDVFTIYFGDRGPGGHHRRPAQQPGRVQRQPANEGDQKDPENVLRRAPHLLQQACYLTNT